MHLRCAVLFLQLLVSLPSIAGAAAVYSWGHSYGDDATQTLTSVATDYSGNVLVCGTFLGSMTFNTTMTASGLSQPDIFIAKLDAAGNALWNRKIGLSYNDEAWDIAGDKNNNVIVVGMAGGASGADVLVTKYNAAGTQLFQKTFDGHGVPDEYAQFASVDLAGNIIVAGKFGYEIDFGGGAITPPDSFANDGMFLAKLDSNGNQIWSKGFEWHLNTGLGGVDVDAMGNIYLHGHFANSIDFGAGAITSNGSSDLFLAKFAPDGRVIWNHHYGSAGADASVCLAVTPDGRSAIAENLYSAVDFGGGLLTPTGIPQPAVAMFTTNGSHVWSKTFAATAYGFAYGITIGENKDVLLTVHGGGSINFGGGPVAAVGANYNEFVARLNGAGAHRWSFAFGGDGGVYGFPAVSRGGGVIVAGYMDGAANPGGGALPYEGENDVFIARFAETLTGVGASPMMAVLYQNVPNPFNPTTSIPYMLEMGRRVEIGIYEVSGSRVVVLNQGMQSPGTHAAIWNGRDASGRAVPSGVYFYRFEGIPEAVGSRKMVLLK